jgi:hypothetical protein
MFLFVCAGLFVLTARSGILIHPAQTKRKNFFPASAVRPNGPFPPQAALPSHLLRYAQRKRKNRHARRFFFTARASAQNDSMERTIGYIISL